MTDANTLGLAGDGDEVCLVEAIERGFSVNFKVADLEQCLTVGDLHRLILAETPHAERSNTTCLSALAFYRLKRTLAAQYPGITLRPSTPLTAFTGRFGATQFRSQLKQQTGLALPHLVGSLSAFLLGLATIGAPFAGYHLWGWPGTTVVLPLACLAHAAGRFLSNYDGVTLGDLARRVGAMNVRRLLPQGTVLRTSEVWSTYVALIRHETGYDALITPETRLIN